MKHSISYCLVTTLATLLSMPAVAQSRFCLGGDLDHVSQAQKTSCSAKLQAVKATATTLHAPDAWHFVMVCGEDGWSSYAAFLGESGPNLVDATAATNLEQKETFLRSDKLDLADPASMQKIVAHEVAGIVLHSNDELAIHKQMKLWSDHGVTSAGF